MLCFVFGDGDLMSVNDWAKKVAAAVLVAPGERAPIDAVLVDFIDDFEVLAHSTRLKIPAFARALTAAGLTLASGAPYDSATLRTQINRARAKRRMVASKEGTSSASSQKPAAAGENNRQSMRVQPARDTPASSTHTSAGSLSVLKRLERSKPKKARRLDDSEGG